MLMMRPPLLFIIDFFDAACLIYSCHDTFAASFFYDAAAAATPLIYALRRHAAAAMIAAMLFDSDVIAR